MASVFESIESALSGNDASVRVDAQSGNLSSIGSLLQGLATNPPTEVASLQRAFGSLELPDFPLSGFVTRITDIKAALPEPRVLLGGTLGDIGSIEGELGGSVAVSLNKALVAFEKVRGLAEIRLSCPDAATPNAGSGTTPSTPPPTPAPTPQPPASQPTQVAAATSEAHAVLDRMPVPFNLRTLLTFLHDVSDFRRTELVPAVIPIFDDVRDPLNTMLRWEALTPAEVLSEIDTSLQEADSFVRTGVESTLAPLVSDLDACVNALPTADLQRIGERLTIRLGELRSAVQAGNLSGTTATVTELNTLLDEYDALRPTVTPLLTAIPELCTRLSEVAGDLDLGMALMVSVLKPGASALTRIPAVQLDAVTRFETWMQGLADWLHDIANILDLSVITGPMGTVASGVQSVASGLQQAVTTITVEVQDVFTRVQSLLDLLDPAAMKAEVDAAVQSFRTELLKRVNALVGPARNAVLQAVTAIDNAVGQFDPGDVVQAVTDAIDALASALSEGPVGEAITAIHDGLEVAANQLSSVTFTPTADSVISVMDGLRAALEAIDPAVLPKAATDALKSAASVLPSDLEPITNPIVEGFGEVVNQGPGPVLQQIAEAPKQLEAAVRAFDPDELIGDNLTEPFKKVVRELEKFRPSNLLKPVEQGLKDFKEQLRRAANPGQATQLLQAPFDEIKHALDGFDPNALIDPLDEAMSAVTGKLLDILPLEETFGVVDDALNALQRVIDTVDKVVSLVRRLHDAANALVDPRGQLQAWVNEVLAKVDGISDTSSLTPRLSALSAALDTTRAAAIGPRFTSGTASARAALDGVNGATRLAALIQAHRGVSRTALQALPASADRTAIETVLNRFDPLLPAFGAPWQQLGELRQGLQDGDAALQVLLPQWDERFHFAGSSLDDLRHAQATTAQLRAWAADSLEQQFVAPLTAAFGFLEPVRQIFNALLIPFEELVTIVKTKLGALLLGPQSITAIRNSLAQVADTLRDLNLDFLRTNLNDLFTSIRAKLDEIDPKKLGAALDQSFSALLDSITIELILPKSDVKQIDDTYAGIVAKLKLLDPSNIVNEVIKPLFEEKVVPLLDRFDIAPFLETIIEKLGGLDDDLREEIGRVNEAYQKLLAALPEGGAQSAGASVSVAA